MKKVEVYFLINLGAILSLFAIEGELAKYKRKQGDILLEVAKDKLEAMVDVNNINSLNSDSLYKFTFDLEGEYDKESVDVTAEFNLNDTTHTYCLLLKMSNCRCLEEKKESDTTGLLIDDICVIDDDNIPID